MFPQSGSQPLLVLPWKLNLSHAAYLDVRSPSDTNWLLLDYEVSNFSFYLFSILSYISCQDNVFLPTRTIDRTVSYLHQQAQVDSLSSRIILKMHERHSHMCGSNIQMIKSPKERNLSSLSG